MGSEEPSDTSSSEQREGEGGSNRAVFSHSAVGTGTFILLDFTLPWLLLTVLVSGRLNQELCPSMVPTLAPWPRCRIQSIFHRQEQSLLQRPLCTMGIATNLAFCQGNGTVLGKPGS